jgi:NAD(P)-dependent dehydrogenase (short-subunit alcohol dehydrogenase family)
MTESRSVIITGARSGNVSPMGRPGTPDEVADVMFLLAVRASCCNGIIVCIDCGSVA